VESKFGITKRRYGLDLIMCKLQETSETKIMIQFMVMNAACRIRKMDNKKKRSVDTVQRPSIRQFTASKLPMQSNCCSAY